MVLLNLILPTLAPIMPIALVESINLTVLLGIITVALAAMGTLIRIFGNKNIKDEDLRQSGFLQGLQKNINDVDSEIKIIKPIPEEDLRRSMYLQKIEKEIDDKEVKINQIKDELYKQIIEIEKIKTEQKNSSKSLDDLRRDNKDLVQRLDSLLKQFMDFMDD